MSTHMCQVDAKEGAVCGERAHGKAAIADEITLSNLDHAAKLCDTLPLTEELVQPAESSVDGDSYRCVKEIPG